ncbi:membrane protein containing Methyltransferase type 11 domain protein, partial [Candidatus Magnetomorum sp. HK-1]
NVKDFSNNKNEQEKDHVFYNIIISTVEKFSNRGIIIDIGCGLGELLSYFYKSGYSVAGFDISYEFVQTAKKKLDGTNSDLPYFVCVADAKHIPFSDSCFSIAICSLVYRLTGNLHKSFSETSRVFINNGLCIGSFAIESLMFKIQRLLKNFSSFPFTVKIIISLMMGLTIFPFFSIIETFKRKDFKSPFKKKYNEILYSCIVAAYSTTFMTNCDFMNEKQLDILFEKNFMKKVELLFK